MSDYAGGRPLRRMRRLTRDGQCTICLTPLDEGTVAMWDGAAGTMTCRSCWERPTVDGAAGAGRSAHDEGRRLAAAAAGRAPGVAAPVVAPVTAGGQGGPVVVEGAAGERRLGDLLDRLAAGGRISVLHDRGLPGSSANIDHLVVAASGVWVIDAKNYTGRVEVVDRGGRRTGARLVVGGRDRTSLVAGARRQCNAVARVLPPLHPDVVVYGAPFGARRRRPRPGGVIDDMLITWEGDLARWLRDPGRSTSRSAAPSSATSPPGSARPPGHGSR